MEDTSCHIHDLGCPMIGLVVGYGREHWAEGVLSAAVELVQVVAVVAVAAVLEEWGEYHSQ